MSSLKVGLFARFIALGRALVPTVLLTACASSPYINDTRPTSLPASAQVMHIAAAAKPRPYSQAKPGSIEYGVLYADETYEEYRYKLIEEYDRQQLVSGGLLTLAAAALGLGAYGADIDVLLGMGLAGGLGYQLGTWNSNQGRLGIYVEGMKAMVCAKTAISPLRIDAPRLAVITARISDLRNAIGDAAMAAGDVTYGQAIVTMQGDKGTALVAVADKELAEIAGVFKTANDLLARAASIEFKVENAGVLLEGKVGEIRALVTEALNGTLADLSKIREAIGSLGDYANLFAPGIDYASTLQNAIRGGGADPKLIVFNAQSGEMGGQGKTGDGDSSVAGAQAYLARSVGSLRAKREQLLGAMSLLKGVVEPISVEAVKSGLKGCGIDAKRFGSVLTLDRTAVTFQPKTAGTALVTITGGTQPFSANLLDLPAKGINTSLPAGGNLVIISAGDDTQAGASYQIKVSDAAKQFATLTVSIAGESSPAANGSKSGDTQPLAKNECSGFETLEREEVCLIQRFVGTPIDGTFGAKTCTALGAAWKGNLGQSDEFLKVIDDHVMNMVKKKAGLAQNGRNKDLAAVRAAVPTCKLPPFAVAATAAVDEQAGPPLDSTKCKVPTGVKTEFECQAEVSTVKEWRQLLKAYNDLIDPAVVQFDDAMRVAVSKLQRDSNQSDNGKISKSTAIAIGKLK